MAVGEVVPHGTPWAYTPDYLPWYYEHSHPYTLPPKEGEPPYSFVCIMPKPLP